MTLPLKVTKRSRRGLTDPDSVWIRRDLRRLTRAEAVQRRPAIGEHAEQHTYWECRQFDPATRQCGNYENRPPCCTGFPWYHGDVMDPWQLEVVPDCGYRSDIPAGLKVALRMATPKEG